MRQYIQMRKLKVLVFCLFLGVLPVESWGQLANSGLDETGFALLVDVSDYSDANIPPLREKSAEVDNIKDALHSAGGFPSQQIQVVAGENATREGIAEALTAIVERAKRKEQARFLFYLKGRSLKTLNNNYFLPYDARLGATSTYIDSNDLMSWFDSVPLGIKALMIAAWDVKAQDDIPFSTQLGEILRDDNVDSDSNRNVTLAEIGTKIRALGFRGDYPIRIVSDGANVLFRLPSILEVNSNPPEADVLLNGVEQGVTPAQILGLVPGTYRVSVRKELHLISEERTVFTR